MVMPSLCTLGDKAGGVRSLGRVCLALLPWITLCGTACVVLTTTSCSTAKDTQAQPKPAETSQTTQSLGGTENACQELSRAETRLFEEFTAKVKAVDDEAATWPEYIPYRDRVLANGGTPPEHSTFQRKRYKRLLPILIGYYNHEISVWQGHGAAIRGCSGPALDKLRQEGLEDVQAMPDTIAGYQKELRSRDSR